MGVHHLPDDRLLCCMHKMPENCPCVAFSEDGGRTWSPPRFIVDVSPGASRPAPIGKKLDHAPGDHSGPHYRLPCALVTQDGRIVVVFGRRSYEEYGSRGVLGVVSDDLGETWSAEFVIRGDAYTWDCGYPVATELADGTIFTVYYITSKDGDQPVPEQACVRYIAGTFFKLG